MCAWRGSYKSETNSWFYIKIENDENYNSIKMKCQFSRCCCYYNLNIGKNKANTIINQTYDSIQQFPHTKTSTHFVDGCYGVFVNISSRFPDLLQYPFPLSLRMRKQINPSSRHPHRQQTKSVIN